MMIRILYDDKLLNKLGLFTRIGGISFYPWIILREKYRDIPYYSKIRPIMVNHELIHIKQQVEMLILPFFILYLLEWFIKLFRYWSFKKSYKNISFEREANTNENNLTYLKDRKLYSWLKYL